jgi:hypothetical protein
VLQVVHLALQAVLSVLLQVASQVVAQVQVHQLVAALLQEDK